MSPEPEYMWEIMNVIHASKAETKIPTQEELETARLRRQQRIDDLMVFTNSPISKVFPQKGTKP